MLPKLEWGERGACRGPLVVMCHWLGGSAETWSMLAERLAERGIRCVAVDLPGFGAATHLSLYSVRQMADAVIATVRDARCLEPDLPWLMAGHSMGGKLAAVIARDAVNGADGLQELRGVVLMAASPPGPEPMKESDRERNLRTLGQGTGDPAKDRAYAEAFVTGNAGEPALAAGTFKTASEGVWRAEKAAIRAWFESGSKEDWRAYVGELPLPALIFAGSEDTALGPAMQREQIVPCFAPARRGNGLGGVELVVLDGARHLIPLERPGAVAERVAEFCEELGLPVSRQVQVGARFGGLMTSDLTSSRTRALMNERLVEDDAAYKPQAVGRQNFRVLRELARRVVPGAAFDLATRVDRRLVRGLGDGWRPAELPKDSAAWRRGLASLEAASRRAHRVGFVELNDELQDALLEQASAGSLGEGFGARLLQAAGISGGHDEEIYDAAEMKLWFEEVRGELSKLYMADPRTMERVGFAGFADEQGFTQIRLDEREVWER